MFISPSPSTITVPTNVLDRITDALGDLLFLRSSLKPLLKTGALFAILQAFEGEIS